MIPPPDAAQASERPESNFGRYILMEELGAGAFGTVVRAWQKDLGRVVAIKFLQPQWESELPRFLREAQTAARLSHANIVSIHEAGQHEGRHFIVMQYIDGEPLDRLRLSFRDVARVMEQAARGVAHAHEQGVIHRDLKPQNIMVTRAGNAVVTDFGLARPLKDDSALTVSGIIMGTPVYMSPEQTRGQPATPLSDVYALGATLYEAVTGRTPFVGATMDVLRKVAHEEPVPPRRIDRDVPADLETIVLKAMEKEPERRYASAVALADDLQQFQRGRPIGARRASLAYRISKTVRRHPLTVGAFAVALAAIVVGSGMAIRSGLQYRESERARRLDERVGTAGLAVRELDRFIYMPDIDPARVRSQAEAIEADLTGVLAERPTPAAFLFRGLARQIRGKHDGAIEDFTAAIERAPPLGDAYMARARVYHQLYYDDLLARGAEAPPHRRDRARLDFEQAGKLLKERRPLNGAEAMVRFAEGRLDEAEKILRFEIAEGGLVQEFHVGLGWIRLLQERPQEARAEFEAALRVAPNDRAALKAHAHVCARLGDEAAARRSSDRAKAFYPD